MKATPSAPFPHRRAASGVALVLVLAFVVLLTVLLTAFFSRAVLNRQISTASAAQFKSEQVARAGLDTLLGDLAQEIEAGSRLDGDPIGASYTVNGRRIFMPKTAVGAMPARVGEPAALKTLLRRSARSGNPGTPDLFPVESGGMAAFDNPADYRADARPLNRASASNTATASLNGRIIPAARWNRPGLLTAGQLTDPAGFTAPDWVILTRSGPRAFGAWSDTLKNSSAATPNLDYALGRYAYAVYDEGSLLDVNLAGYPSALDAIGTATSDRRAASGKGAPFFADLRRLGGSGDAGLLSAVQVEDFVRWRNASTAGNPAAFVDFARVLTPPLGFLGVKVGDQALVSRQELLGYAKAKKWNPDALRFLGTFSRELNAPSFSPATPSVTNPNLALAILNGKPLRRFPLNARLATLETGTDAAKIAEYFGLSAAADSTATHRHWTYRASKIDDLPTVLAANRSPNLFELLKAGVNASSLGVAYRGTYLRELGKSQGDPTKYLPDTMTDDQVIRIGANLIDQHDADNYPTTITFGGLDFWGVENLPYFSEFFVQMYRPGPDDSSSNTTNQPSTHYLFFELWNPHQPDAATVPGPGGVRVAVNAAATYSFPYWWYPGYTGYGANYSSTASSSLSFPPYALETADLGVEPFREPRVINNPAGGGATRIGGDGSPLNAFVFNADFKPNQYGLPWANERFTIDRAVFRLEYQDASGWHPYSTFGGYDEPAGYYGLQNGASPVTAPAGAKTIRPTDSIPKPDPRTFRYGASMSYAIGNSYYNSPPQTEVLNVGMVSNSPQGQTVGNNTGDTADYPGAGHPGMLFMNQAARGVYTAGNDGVVRPADGALDATAADPMRPGNAAARPVILNRPFRSVGELGYVFRDEPWKTLDLFSDQSADAGLLDLFCLEDSETVAGRVNLNTQNPEVLKALLAGALRQEAAVDSGMTGADAETLAARLVAATQAKPLLNKAGLVAALAAPSAGAALPAIKTEREAAARALGQNGGTRTWNLLVDLVAQAGRYPPTARNFDQFVVEGERRVWLHVAIDRYTGEVLGSQLENVDE